LTLIRVQGLIEVEGLVDVAGVVDGGIVCGEGRVLLLQMLVLRVLEIPAAG
jgi:hypothetical protein